jgi:crossover junction endodeoxyribonuclease RuvC
LKVLGIDPGSRITGYGVIELKRNGMTCITFGDVKPSEGAPLSECLRLIYDDIIDVARKTLPDALAIEDIFYGKNVKSLIRQSHVRGTIVLAGSQLGIPMFEYTPLEIKKAVVGYGRAEKRQIQTMVRTILNLSILPKTDAADALAVAICHANFLKDKPI